MATDIKVPDIFFTVPQLAIMFGNRHRTFIIKRIKAGEFGADVLDVDGEYLVPSRGAQFFAENHRLIPANTNGVHARSTGELRRKLAA